MHVETRVTFWYLFKTNFFSFIFLPFLGIFSILPSTQTIEVIGLIFFLFELAMKIWAIEMHFNSIRILYDFL